VTLKKLEQNWKYEEKAPPSKTRYRKKNTGKYRMTWRRGRKRKQLLGDFEETRTQLEIRRESTAF